LQCRHKSRGIKQSVYNLLRMETYAWSKNSDCKLRPFVYLFMNIISDISDAYLKTFHNLKNFDIFSVKPMIKLQCIFDDNEVCEGFSINMFRCLEILVFSYFVQYKSHCNFYNIFCKPFLFDNFGKMSLYALMTSPSLLGL